MKEMPGGQQEHSKNIEEEYASLIGVYKSKVQELKKIQRRAPKDLFDKEIETALKVIDLERHNIHLQLIELGKQLKKSENDVLVDIIRKDGTLDAYGLPEFSILTEKDIVNKGDEHGMGGKRGDQYDFNVDADEGRPLIEASTSHPEGESLIKSDEVLFVFAIMRIKHESTSLPEDYSERRERAKALAAETLGRVFEAQDSGWHDAYAEILGVVVPKKDFGKVVSLIRDNPNKYRLGKEFYSASLPPEKE